MKENEIRQIVPMLKVGKATLYNKGGSGEFIGVKWFVSGFDELTLYAHADESRTVDEKSGRE